MIYLIGMGTGAKELRTIEAQNALKKADLIIGARRLVDALEEEITGNRFFEYDAKRILAILEGQKFETAAILFSGDLSFYSGAKSVRRLLRTSDRIKDHEIHLIPGISCVSYFCAAVDVPLEEVTLQSAHGVDVDIVSVVAHPGVYFFITGGEHTPATLCGRLDAAGWGDLVVTIGENLSYENERIVTMTAREGAKWSGSDLAVMMVRSDGGYKRLTPGISDEAFIRGNVPMTKRMIRMDALCLLNPNKHEVCWDIGAGTGSVSVELSMFAKRVYAIEKNPEAVDLIRKNRQAFCAYNIDLVEGSAPEVLSNLKPPQVVFIGGSSGKISEILAYLPKQNVRLCVTAVTLETLEDARKAMTDAGFSVEISQVAITNIRPAGNYHMLNSQNPVFIIYGER